MTSSTWQDHFKEQLVGLEAPREGSFLELALNEGRITEKDYLQWASETQLIPLLSPNYFTEASPDQSLLGKAPLPWRSTFFPVAEWDGHLIVAGLEKPQQLPPHCSFVLASREGLALWWEKLAEHAAPLEGPDGIEMGAAVSLDTLDLAPESAAAPALSFAGISVAAPVAAPPTEQAPVLSAESESSPSLETALPDESSAETKIGLPLATEETSGSARVDSVPTESSPSVSTEGTHTRTFIAFEGNQIPEPPKIPIPFKVNSTLEKHTLTEVALNSKTFKTELQRAMTQLSGAYPKTMVLVLDEKRQSLIPYAWSETLKTPSIPAKIPLGSASFFEIVSATEKPYHGPVVPNEINSNFLNAWNEGAVPETLTIVPLLGNQQIHGMILGMGPQTSYTMAILRFAEKTAADLMKTWKFGAHSAA